ncbi:glycosyltransferase family 32 protein [Commensalibacter oyaizuii]|uniref:Glycosyltransferase n=1 Tax=Commensalibacter oyaizuii TaxID=3043873 RepID=A0ABT6Q1J2_9PROT|nr:glycosyltransferase [Commensalibacter sp. TBRC 16381]MDI2090982.1 glycosyltransferase [Commensalibacter sp. TBRC 16381]
MFTQEEKEKAKYFKYALHPLNEVEHYLNPRYFSMVDTASQSNQNYHALDNIPKHICLFWHQRKLPQDVKESIDKIKRYNSAYHVTLFNYDSAHAFIYEHYGAELSALFERRCVHPSMQSDLFRICYLLQKGGIYVDVDIECYASLDLTFPVAEFGCLLFYSRGKPCCIDNDFIVCAPQNEIIAAILQKMQSHLTAERSFANVWECTGPGAVSLAIMELLMNAIINDLPKGYGLGQLLLADHQVAIKAYRHAELGYKQTQEGNWRSFQFPKHLYRL